jgi:hypothetical protein
MIDGNMTGGAIVRTKWAYPAAIGGACVAMIASAASASAETAQEVINDLQSKGYTVTIDKIGTAPISDCTVTSVRNPQNVTQLVPYVGPGLGGSDNRLLVPATVSQTISVSLNCSP